MRNSILKSTILQIWKSNFGAIFNLDARYISASEATWRIFHYRLHNEKPDIIQLSVYLPGQHRVLFQGNERLEDILTRSAEEKTTLTAWFHANTKYPHARRLTYAEFPSQWVYNKKTKEWKPRQRGNSIGRIYFIHPAAGEKYYLRMLLNVVRGSTSFENIRTVNGIFYHTFKEACIALNLLQDDEEWNQCLQEASQVQGGAQLRKLFATILLFCEPTRPKILWEKHIFALSDDILHQVRHNSNNMTLELTDDDIHNRALHHLQVILSKNGRLLTEFPNMPIPPAIFNDESNRLIREEQEYDIEELLKLAKDDFLSLNTEQRAIFDKVIKAVETKTPAIFFVDGPGGTGKTFLYSNLLAKVRLEKRIAIAVASSGIAALLLPGGRTAHSCFKIPLEIHEDSTCAVKHGSDLASLLQVT
ncbi:unnamed protein product [Rhizophagus irregularis]|nr:unnamed protein product [Rhizophagus irregularis]